MLSDEQINEIIEGYQADFTDGFEQTRKAIYVEDVPMLIKEALALAEKSRWKYPDKGELPEDEKIVLIVLSGRKNCDMAIHDKQGKAFIEVVDHLHFPYGQVKAWTYAPVLED